MSSSSSSTTVNHLSQPCIYGDAVSAYSERKSSFMKWLCKIFKGGSSSGSSRRSGQPSLITGDESSVLCSPVRSLDDCSRTSKDKEEMGRAVARPLPQDLKRPNGYRWKDNDDHLRSLHDGLSSSSRPPYAPPYATPKNYHPRGYRVCGGCHREIGHGNYLGCVGTYFHPECFRCHACGYPITENEFSLSEKKTYHKLCFKELSHPKCEVCHRFIPINNAGLIEYRCHPFWSQKYCPSHEYDLTARCCSCERFESRDAKYISLGDGRSLCMECMESAIMDTGDCQPLYHAIRDYYEGMNMKIDQQVPMLLVERQALNEAIEGEKQGFHHLPETRGLCLSEEQTVTSVQKGPRMGGRGLVGMRKQPQRLTRKSEVTAILVLYGLPRLLTGAILAHELMHAWLRLKGFRNLRTEVEEGICQVMSHMWLESEVMPGLRNSMPSTSSTASSSSSTSSKKGRKSVSENKLGEFFMHQIAHDTSSAYGEGFRMANEAVNKYGLWRTLNNIYLTGNFP
ncbi:unnamed protein product [Cuscuta campestris]|uniref:LIM zinc-binding domain-containing protein n=1 Tax=Cuscuta campestris TaxID=132261 RepID=A0A484L8Z0_9ASTE|nr:unnamed protein product [Cuscuta campestris]